MLHLINQEKYFFKPCKLNTKFYQQNSKTGDNSCGTNWPCRAVRFMTHLHRVEGGKLPSVKLLSHLRTIRCNKRVDCVFGEANQSAEGVMARCKCDRKLQHMQFRSNARLPLQCKDLVFNLERSMSCYCNQSFF